MQSWFMIIVPSCYNDDHNDTVYKSQRTLLIEQQIFYGNQTSNLNTI